jgi:ribA/ribD-fused uncharacterized protein
MISRFINKHSFLSNFYTSPFLYNGKYYKTVEHAYQSYKSNDEGEREWIRNAPDARTAKIFSHKIKIRKDWESIKYKLMYELVLCKFKQNNNLKTELIKTDDEYIEEGNYWHDNIWGNCDCDGCKEIEGKNWLGKILMKIRDEIKNKK